MRIVGKKITMKEECMLWVSQFKAFPISMIQKLFQADLDDWEEITPILEGMRVFSHEFQEFGVVLQANKEISRKDSYIINLDSEKKKESFAEDLYVVNSDYFPMWGTMWQFYDVCDEEWIEYKENQRKMAECGFRIYQSKEFGYFFGIDGAGYDFYKKHWIPLYKIRRLHQCDTINF